MLAALVVAVIAILFAGVAVAAALGAQRVVASDGVHARARTAALAGIEHGLHRVCWTLVAHDAEIDCEVDLALTTGDTPRPEIVASVTLESAEAAGLGWPASAHLVRVRSEADAGSATAAITQLVALRPSAVPRGLSVAEDADVQAPLALDGCGACVGGVLRGREYVTAASPDHAWGGRWPAAGVHAGGGIWAAGTDTAILDPLPEAYAADTVGADVAELVELPGAAWLGSARLHALDPGDALAGGVLHLDRLPAVLPTGEPGAAEAAGRADLLSGYLVFVPARALDGGVVVTGVRDPSWAPVTVAIEGDAVLAGDPGDGGLPPAPALDVPPAPAVAFRGALVVTGHLRVAAPAALAGHVACRRFTVAAALTLSLDEAWRERPPVGFLEPLLLARG
jgi:hypothetical protein